MEDKKMHIIVQMTSLNVSPWKIFSEISSFQAITYTNADFLSPWQEVGISIGNSLIPNWCQDITWPNDDFILRYQVVSQ